jgi:hydroxypyruvate reductase
LGNKIPASILRSLHETLKPADPFFENVQNVIIASNETALRSAQLQAQRKGFETQIIRSGLKGEASIVGREIAMQFRESLNTIQRPFCLLAGGETTVTLNGDGKGGRNQELALASVDILNELKNVVLVSVATDGEDGPTDAAGAVVSGETAQRAGSLGMSVAGHLSRNDAYTFFEALGDLVKTNPSGTNVNDLILCFAF